MSLRRETKLSASTFRGRLRYLCQTAFNDPWLSVLMNESYFGWVGLGLGSGRVGLPLPSHQNAMLPAIAIARITATIPMRNAIFTVFLSSLNAINATTAKTTK